MEQKQIEEIRKRCEAATPGPWVVKQYDDCFIEPSVCMIPANGCYDYNVLTENSQFIAHARQDVPNLLDYIEQLQAEYNRLNDFEQTQYAKLLEENGKLQAELAEYKQKELKERQERILNPAGEYAVKFARNHGITIEKAMEEPMVKARFEVFNATGY